MSSPNPHRGLRPQPNLIPAKAGIQVDGFFVNTDGSPHVSRERRCSSKLVAETIHLDPGFRRDDGVGIQSGFSLIEVLVALLIFAIVATGLAQTLVAAQTTRHTSALWMEASQLAAAESERVRSGERTGTAIKVGPFSCATTIEAEPAYADLARVRVTVDWVDREPRRLELVTLMSDASDNE